MRLTTTLATTAALLLLALAATTTPANAGDPPVSADNGWVTGVDKTPGQKKPNRPAPPRPAPPRPRHTPAPKPPVLNSPGPHCGANTDLCNHAAQPKPIPKPKTPDPATTAREAVARLKLTDPTPHIGPNPNNNPWHMLTVGYPLWLWTSTPATLTTTTNRQGLTITLTATRTHTTYDHGDHTTQTCAATTPYEPQAIKPATPSPTCGHIYTTPSPIGDPYTITATDHWTVDWRTNTQHGTLNTTTTGHTTITIGQLASLTKG